MNIKNKQPQLLVLALLFGLIFSSCKKETQTEEIPEFPVIRVSSSPVSVSESYSASMQGQQDVEIYPQVSGTISRILVNEGQRVSKGQLLFVIDQRPYRVALQMAKANVKAAEAKVETARLDLASKQELFNENVVSEYDLLTARNALTSAEAELEQRKAAEVDADNSLSYTEVKSPSDGFVGVLPFKTGALVSPGITEPLTTVSDNTNIHVYFSMSENQMRELLDKYGTPEDVISHMPDITLRLSNGAVYPNRGRIESISGVINPQTGTLSVRSVFPNPRNLLWSGSVGNVLIPHNEKSVLVIPQNVTYEIQDKIIVYKIADGKAKAAFIKVKPISDGKQYVVTEGLSEGDIIISEGVGQVKDGMEIKIKE